MISVGSLTFDEATCAFWDFFHVYIPTDKALQEINGVLWRTGN